MGKPESRRFKPPIEAPGTRKIVLSSPSASSSDPARPPTGKTTRSVPRTTRRAPATPEDEERQAAVAAAREETKSKNQFVLIGGIGGGVLLLIIVIAIAASSGGSSRAPAAANRPVKKAVAPPPEPPPEPKRSYNYVRNTGSIVFVCGGSEKHPDREVVIGACPKCGARNLFEVDSEASGYRCTSCKGVTEYGSVKCELCDRVPRVTKLKKVLATQQ
jgi:hypothetical protein